MSENVLDGGFSDYEKEYKHYLEQSRLSQTLKYAVKDFDGWDNLDYHDKESIEMIMHNVARLVACNCNFAGYWQGIADYALLIVKRIQEEKKSIDVWNSGGDFAEMIEVNLK